MSDLRVQGLRTAESNKFLIFWKIVQDFAKKNNAVFFLDSGDGHEFENDNINAEDCSGWLIPFDKVTDFEKDFLNNKNLEQWDDFFSVETWKIENGKFIIEFA